MILNDLYKLLVKNGYTQVYEGTLPAQPDDVIGLFLTGGNDHLPWVDEPTFQIRVRSDVYNNSYQKAKQLKSLLLNTRDHQSETREYKGFHIIGDIQNIGKDVNGRDEFTVNFRTYVTHKPEYDTALLLVEKVEENRSYDIYNMAYAYMNEYNITDDDLRNRLYAIERLEGSPEDDLLDVMSVYLDLAQGSLSRFVYTAAVNYKTVNEITDETVITRLALILQLIEDKEAQEAIEEAQRLAEIDAFQTTIAGKTAEIEAKALEITTLEQDIVNLNTTVGTLTGEKAALELQLDEKVGDILALEAERTTLMLQLSELQATIADRDATIASLQLQIATLDADIVTLQATIDSQTGDITTLQAQLLDMTTQRDALQAQLDAASQPVMGIDTIPRVEGPRAGTPTDLGTYSYIVYDRVSDPTVVDSYKTVLVAEGFTTWEMQESPGGLITHESSSDGARIVDLIYNPYDELLEVRVTMLDADYFQAQIALLQADIDQKVIEINTLGDEITGYINQIDTLNAQITTKDGEITTLTGQVSTQQATIDALNLEIASLQQQIADLQAASGGGSEEIDYLKTWGRFNFTETTDGMVLASEGIDIIIPADVVYLESRVPVVEIAANKFENLSIRTVEMQEGMKRIGDYAFNGCSNLETVIWPSTLQSIGRQAFYGCSKLTSAVLSAGVYMDYQAFYGCNGLTHVDIPSGATFGQQAFAYCNNLASVTLPEGIAAIPSRMFMGCKALTTINIPSTLQTIGDYAFDYAPITEIELPEGFTSIDIAAFRNSGLTSIGLPSTLTSIGSNAFQYTSITSVKLAANIPVLLNVLSSVLNTAYVNNNKAAGLYTLSGTTWTYQGPVAGYGL